MKAVGLTQYLPIENEASLLDVELEKPTPGPRDLLVKVHAVAVNPVDAKVRAPNDKVEETPRILGWDVSGDVVEVGGEVEHYAIGDKVFYAGDITRPGCNSEFHAVDERIVGAMPKSLSYADSAALPLTSITAWEGLFHRLGISSTGDDAGKSILIVGGAGGVGSIAIQLASQVAGLKVIATASRPESREWVTKLGASAVINHRNALDEELKAIEHPHVDFIFCLNSTEQHWAAMCNAIAPQGMICSIVETPAVDLDLLKVKSAGFVWEFMFTRSMFKTPDMIEQQRLLNAVAALIDDKKIETTTGEVLRPINASNLRQAHATLEAGRTVGKIVLEGW